MYVKFSFENLSPDSSPSPTNIYTYEMIITTRIIIAKKTLTNAAITWFSQLINSVCL